MKKKPLKPQKILNELLTLKILLRINRIEKKMDNKNKIEKDSPFNLAWLDSSYYETLLPGTPWQDVKKIIFISLYLGKLTVFIEF